MIVVFHVHGAKTYLIFCPSQGHSESKSSVAAENWNNSCIAAKENAALFGREHFLHSPPGRGQET